MMWIGIAIMAIGFIGVCVFAKMKQQPPAAGAAVLMLVGLGIYMWYYLNPPPDRSGEYFAMSVAAKIAQLPDAKPAKLWIASDITGDYYKNIQDAYKSAGGAAEWKSCVDGEGGMFSIEKFKEIIKGCTKDDIVIIDVGVMEHGDDFKKILKDANSPKFFLTNNATGSFGMNFKEKEVEKLFNDGKIVGAIVYQEKFDNEYKPSDSDLEEAFSKRFVVVTKDNWKNNKAQLGFMEGGK